MYRIERKEVMCVFLQLLLGLVLLGPALLELLVALLADVAFDLEEGKQTNKQTTRSEAEKACITRTRTRRRMKKTNKRRYIPHHQQSCCQRSSRSTSWRGNGRSNPDELPHRCGSSSDSPGDATQSGRSTTTDREKKYPHTHTNHTRTSQTNKQTNKHTHTHTHNQMKTGGQVLGNQQQQAEANEERKRIASTMQDPRTKTEQRGEEPLTTRVGWISIA
jgi:hypothetical protein